MIDSPIIVSLVLRAYVRAIKRRPYIWVSIEIVMNRVELAPDMFVRVGILARNPTAISANPAGMPSKYCTPDE
jgi:hypothetical protein